MEATNRVCEIFDSIEHLLYTGVKTKGMPERVVTECDDWRLIFPQLRLEGKSGHKGALNNMGASIDLSTVTLTTRGCSVRFVSFKSVDHVSLFADVAAFAMRACVNKQPIITTNKLYLSKNLLPILDALEKL